jgi:hypothetical protein
MTNLDAEKQFSFDYLVANSTSDPSKLELAGIAISDPIDTGGSTPSEPAAVSEAGLGADGPSDTALIAGIIGGIIGVALLAMLCFLLWRKRKKTPALLPVTPNRYDRRDTTTPFQIDLTSQVISPFTSGLDTYQDSPWDRDHKRSPLVSGPPQSAFAFHSYLSGVPRSPASSADTLILLGSGTPRRSPNSHSPHSRQQSISEYMTAQSQSSGQTETSPRPRGAQFSLPAISLPPKMFVLGLDGEVEPLNTPNGRNSRVSSAKGQ